MKKFIYFFGSGKSAADPSMKDILGGKGASLVQMSNEGLPVPPGFIISTECCKYYFENKGKWPAGLEEELRENLAKLEQVTKRKYGSGKNVLLVSVRSGAAVSMPGMMDTILNCGITPKLAEETKDTPQFWRVYIQFITRFAKIVAGIKPEEFEIKDAPSRETAEKYLKLYKKKSGKAFPVDPWETLVECINTVFESWNSERANAYRQKNDVRGLIGTAVTVQAMFPSAVSGVLFTRDPNSCASNHMIIESSYGLGEAVVSGDVTPDRFLVDRDSFKLIKSVLGKKSDDVSAFGSEGTKDIDAFSLNPEQVKELSGLGMKLEKLYNMPMDIEFGLDKGVFSLLQCRRIRGLEIIEDVELGRQEEIDRLKKTAANKHRIWVVHNLGETLAAPTPLTWDIMKKFMSGSGGFGLLYKDLGYMPSKEVCENGFLELICGRIYADPDRVAQLFWEGIPMTYDIDLVLKNKNLLDAAPTKFDVDKTDETFLMKFPAMLKSLIKSSKIMKKSRKVAKEHFEKEVLPPYLEYVKTKRAMNLSKLKTEQLIAELKERNDRVMNEFGKESLKPGFFGGVALGTMQDLLMNIMGEEKGAQLARDLTSVLKDDITVEQNMYLCKIAKKKGSMKEFLDRFGHRTVGEMELAEARWREDQKYIEQIISSLTGAGDRFSEEAHAEKLKNREEMEKGLMQLLVQNGGSSMYEDIIENLREAQKLLPYRELGKHYLMMGYELLRLVILELSSRWDLGRDIYFLRLEELPQFEGNKDCLVAEIAKRKTRWQSAKKLDLPDVIDSKEIDKLGLPQEYKDSDELKGDGVAPGISTGPAKIIFDPREAKDMGSNYILVCPSTDPGWTPLFISAKGLVVEHGGLLSHGAIVARDFGIPAVVCPDATKRIAPGSIIKIDGNRGTITVIEKAGK